MPKGLFDKYTITKTDGSPIDPSAQYFVLRLDTDPAAVGAVLAYAELILRANPELHNDICTMVFDLFEPECVDCDTPLEWGGKDAQWGYCEKCGGQSYASWESQITERMK